MTQFSVAFWLEAASLEEAEALVATWVVTPDVTTLLPITGSVSSDFPPTVVGGTGAVSDALAAMPEDDTEE